MYIYLIAGQMNLFGNEMCFISIVSILVLELKYVEYFCILCKHLH